MITTPTADLTGIVSDALPFAGDDKAYAMTYSVHLYWDGQMLHAEATDHLAVGRSSWQPWDDPETDVQPELGIEWGGADDPWSVVMTVDEAKELVSVFKLPAKQGWTPLYVELIDGVRLKIFRHKGPKHTAITLGIEDAGFPYPDLDKVMKDALFSVPTAELWINARLLGAFASVRQRGTMHMTFGGENKVVEIAIGARFHGAVMPIGAEKRVEPQIRSLREEDVMV